jgi:ABC-2 type transport system ATP-binding protein
MPGAASSAVTETVDEAAQATAVIAVEHLTKRFGEVVAVDDLTFSVEPGQVCGLLGPNGAGKSTTLRVLVGLERPARGWPACSGRSLDRVVSNSTESA